MRSEHEAMMVVRGELCQRVSALRRLPQDRVRDFEQSVVGIRRLAAAYGLVPVVRLSEAFERAMARPDSAGACQRSLYLDRMDDAIGCERLDEAASEAMIASVSVRFA